jgi:ABC-type multidrug transport system ATPase subunit
VKKVHTTITPLAAIDAVRSSSGSESSPLSRNQLRWTKGDLQVTGAERAGKSTLIRILTTLLPPTEGTALVNSFDVRREATECARRGHPGR